MSSTVMQQTDRRPWYREPLVWMVIAIPLSAILMGAVMLPLSILTWDGLVADDYYKKGLAINETKARDTAAQAHGLAMRLEVEPASGALSIELTSSRGQALPEQLRVDFHHGTRGGLDRTLIVPRLTSGRYEAPMPKLAPGRWDVEVSDQDWRLLEVLFAD